jgi:hypothetical protein
LIETGSIEGASSAYMGEKSTESTESDAQDNGVKVNIQGQDQQHDTNKLDFERDKKDDDGSNNA